MADNLARSGDDDSSLDSILSRLNSLGESATQPDESAAPLRGVPDLPVDEDQPAAELEDVPGPPSLSVVQDNPSDASPFRSQGLFDSSVSDSTDSATPAASGAPVVDAEAVAAVLSNDESNDSDDEVDDHDEVKDDEVKEEEANKTEDKADDSASNADDEVESGEPVEKIDFFADLHRGKAPQIAGVAPDKRVDFVPEPELDEGLTAAQAFSHHPADKEVIYTDAKGLLSDPLDIKDTAPKNFDAAAYEERFAHGVQFPGMDSQDANFTPVSDPSHPMYVENPYATDDERSKGISIKTIIFIILLVIAAFVLYTVLGDSGTVGDLREGVGRIAE